MAPRAGTILMLNVCAAEVFCPLFRVPPLSWARRVTSAVPPPFSAGVEVRGPFELTAGGTLNKPLLLLLTRKLTIWPVSFDGPGKMFVAQLATVCAPALLLAV